MKRRRLKSSQLPLFTAPKAVRKRRGAKRGPKVRADRVGFVAHRTRPVHVERHPVHVSIKRVRLAPSLRSERIAKAIMEQVRVAVARGIRVIELSIQADHLHLIVEGFDKQALARGLKFLFSRIAMKVNRIAGRRGALFRDRHHRHELRTPTEVRRALVYVLFNTRKHAAQVGGVSTDGYDPCSSLIWFDAWHPKAAPPPDEMARRRQRAGPRPFALARTWLAREGWKRAGGPLRFDECPG